MAGNIKGDNEGNILVEFDYNNIILIDPNKTIDNQGNIQERLVDHENLIMYANLTAQVIPRTKLAVGSTNDVARQTISVASMNFLRPGSNQSLTTGYYDELTGLGSLQGQASNQPLQKTTLNKDKTRAITENTIVDQQSVVDNGLLGITSINVRVSSSFIPTVSIRLEDVQGKALFQLGNNSPYSAFFNLPYPQFYLTLKGYFGQAIQYQLNLEKFNARFNSSNGNYEVALEFKGYKFNILNEVSISHLLATPLMYNKTFQVQSTPAVANSSTNNADLNRQSNTPTSSNINTSSENGNSVVETYYTSRGYQKIKEVYSEYKSKGLIAPDFPELTFMELIYKLDTFERNITNSFDKVQVEPLTNIKNYKSFLKKLFNSVRGTQSWFRTYLEPNPIIYKDSTKVYYFKQIYIDKVDLRTTALSKLNELIINGKKPLEENPTLGLKKPDEIKQINLISLSQIQKELNLSNIDYNKTAESFYGNSNTINVTTAELKVSKQLNKSSFSGPNNEEKFPPVFIFEGKGSFIETLNQMEVEADRKLQNYQTAITEKLSTYIQDSSTGIGFKPTVRNMIAVIMATTEAFIRLMEDVHTNAWNVKYDDTRRLIIQNNSNSGVNTESNNQYQTAENAMITNSAISNSMEPVYPWPTFFKESPDDKKGRFQLTYLGDSSVVDQTQAYNFKKWPEVEFVEEYIKGLAQKLNNPTSNPPNESQYVTQIINFNPIEFPETGLSYRNKEELKFFYEIWERQFVTSHYSNFSRLTINANQLNQLVNFNRDAETNNIVKSLGLSSPFITFKLKNSNLTANNYEEFLRVSSNDGTGRNYQQLIRDFYVTPYLKAVTENPFSVLSITDLGLEPQYSVQSQDALNQIVNGTINTPLVIDTYPFTNSKWVSEKMVNGASATNNTIYNTNKSLKVFEDRNTISNFTNLFDYTTNRPVTNFSYETFTKPEILTQTSSQSIPQGLKDFYIRRTPSNFISTEGYCIQNSPARTLDTRLTTSILNTPYFINAIQEGVQKEASGNEYPYVSAAYLFLSSLPAATLKEKYKTKGITSDLDYIASCFNKYTALHKMPYVWILKLGAIWYRYKNYIQNNNDILTNSWKNFDYVQNYDPKTNSTSKTYTFKIPQNSNDTNITLETTTPNQISIQVGFYPKLINDFNYFLNGTNLYKDYTNQEIQNSVNSGMLIHNFNGSNINLAKQNNIPLNLNTWSVLIPSAIPNANTQTPGCDDKNNIQTDKEYFIIPSFGCNLNQTSVTCIQNPTTPSASTTVNLTQNPSMYNGSVRTMWASPNFGYFDSAFIKKPSPDSYMTRFLSNENDISPLYLDESDSYSKIEEIFSVFDKNSLDIIEKEFLNFCKPATNIFYNPSAPEFDRTLSQLNGGLRNFQNMMRNIMKISPPNSNEGTGQIFNKAIGQQLDNFKNQMVSFFQYDFLLRNGNPSKYSRRVFDSYLSQNSNNPRVINPITFQPYVAGTLPVKSGAITLAQSKLRFPAEWVTLQTEVGFSTIPGIEYTDTGSTIFDFFIDNNIAFTSPNIILLSQLIKMYATQKNNGTILNAEGFKTLLTEYLNQEENLQNLLLGQVLSKTQKELPNQSQLPESAIQSRLESLQGKVEMYEVFKSLNDKWISGADYTTRTLFEDILFLDRASRNIGDTIILDVFAIKKMLNKDKLNENMSVYTLIAGMLIDNNFNVMPLPAYVNFYNVQQADGVSIPNPEGSLEFADNLWGTFNNVDYRNSGPKMVCFFVGKPSGQVKLPKEVSPYGDDSFEMRRASQNPLIENIEGKKDYAFSNKCVGFSVDVGIRNQNIFTQMNVSQDNGKATSEAIQAYMDMVNNAGGRNTGTQNQSLYNLYKNRSYQCEITCLGNALIQPTMYFNLRHVPMFNGPYYITEVSHQINPGSFATTFTGTRQSVYDLPAIDNFLQSINQNLVSQLERIIVNKENKQNPVATTDQSKANQTTGTGGQTSPATPNSCVGKTAEAFNSWEPTVQETKTSITPTEFVKVLKQKIPSNERLQTMIYLLSYVRTFNTDRFQALDYNLALLDLTKNLPNTQNVAGRFYFCQNVTQANGTEAKPMIIFSSLEKYIDHMSAILTQRVNQFYDDIVKYYVLYFPVNTDITSEWWDKNKDTDPAVQTYKKSFDEAKKSAEIMGLKVDFSITPQPVTQQTTITLPVCPPTIITKFSPQAGTTGTIVTLEGDNLQFVRNISIVYNNLTQDADKRSFQFISNNKIKFSIPSINVTTQTNCTITITSSTSTTPISVTPPFVFNP
jgi:hypothetical protein